MSQQTVTKCDICGKGKGDANKWIKYSKSTVGPPSILIGTDVKMNGLDACSDACIQKALAPVLDRIRDYDHATTATIKERGPISPTEQARILDKIPRPPTIDIAFHK